MRQRVRQVWVCNTLDFIRDFTRQPATDSRGVDYLATRPDWDGKTLLVTGASQGGLQSMVAAGLNSNVTAIIMDVPAGCDNTADQAGRMAGWPYWMNNSNGKDAGKVRQTAGYYDAVSFASRITCPVLAGIGLVDLTARPAGIFAAINQMKGPVEVAVMPAAAHQGAHDAYAQRMKVWRASLLKDGTCPVSKRD